MSEAGHFSESYAILHDLQAKKGVQKKDYELLGVKSL